MQEQSPYAAPNALVEDSPRDDGIRLGGRGERLGAVIIDGIIQGLAFAVLVVPVVVFTGIWRTWVDTIISKQGMPFTWSIGMAVVGLVIFVVVQGYPLASTGQTWGKKLLKLKIVDLEGAKPDFVRLIGLRYAVGWAIQLIPVVGMIYSLVDSLFIFRDDKRCIHDHIAGTRVVVAD